MTIGGAATGLDRLAALRAAAEAEAGPDRPARNAYRAEVDAFLDARSADERHAVQDAERTAVVIWRGERLAYRDVPARIADVPGRTERNALSAAYREAVAAINPLREATHDARLQAARDLGYEDLAQLHEAVAGYRLDELAADTQRFLFESETHYFAALRRYLALVDIEQGDGTEADLAHVLRGSGFRAWFDRRDLPRIIDRVAGDLGLETPAIDRPAEGGHAAYADALARLGGALADAGASEPTRGGDPAIREGYALLFERLLLDSDWLRDRLGVPDTEIPMVGDFLAFVQLYRLRRQTALLLYELRFQRGIPGPLAQAYYSGMVGMLTGVTAAETDYLVELGDREFAGATGFRASAFAGAVWMSLVGRYGPGWWHTSAAGDMLRRAWSRGSAWNADDVVAHLGYNALEWRPVLRQIRTQLVGEMSGYGGPNITTRAGTRKI